MQKMIWMATLFSALIILSAKNGLAQPTQEAYWEYLKSAANAKDLAALKSEKKSDVLRDDFGALYAATAKGLVVSAPPESREKSDSRELKALKLALRAIQNMAKWVGWKWLATFVQKFTDGDNGCLLIDGEDGLPVTDLTSISKNSDGDFLLGSNEGVILWTKGKFLYFAGPRWLDDNQVEKAIFYKGNLLVQTRTGVSKIRRFQFTLAEKERYFDQVMDKQFKRFGFVSPSYNGKPNITDNDGLWTAIYAAAQSFKYAAVKDENARNKAAESINALLFLRKVTGQPGFFARAAVHKSEGFDFKIVGGEWHRSAVYPDWFWKGDTSFDELIGHFFAYGVFYDFAANSEEKKEILRQVNAITDHLLANKFCLIDADGQPTKWGKGNPEETFRTIRYFLGRGPLSLGALSVLKTAAHITGREDLKKEYRRLIAEYRYALNVFNAKVIDNYSDNQLAWLAYYNLIRLEENPELKSWYLTSLERYWKIVRQEKNPLWNFLYEALSGNAGYASAAVWTLQEMPLDLRRIRMENSRRQDIQIVKVKKRGEFWKKDFVLQSAEVISPRERGLIRWNSNPYLLDDGDFWMETELEPSHWLLPYWMGKYYKLI